MFAHKSIREKIQDVARWPRGRERATVEGRYPSNLANNGKKFSKTLMLQSGHDLVQGLVPVGGAGGPPSTSGTWLVLAVQVPGISSSSHVPSPSSSGGPLEWRTEGRETLLLMIYSVKDFLGVGWEE